METKGVLVPLLLAVGAAVVYLGVLTEREAALSHAYETANVVVAKVDVPERTALHGGLVETAAIPRKFMEQDAFEVRVPSDLKLLDNLVTRVRIPKGNQVQQSQLSALSPEAGLSVKVPPGYRGTTMPVDRDLLRLLKPGDRVDVLSTFDARMADATREKMTATILQNVLVLGVGENLGQGQAAKEFQEKAGADQQAAAFSEKGALSLAMNSEEAEYLALALQQGPTTVILRSMGDTELHPIPVATYRKLIH